MRKTAITLCGCALLALLATSVPAASAPKKEKPPAYALLFVSIFTEDGFALPGVPVSVKVKGEKKRKWNGVSDSRGECAVRLPAGRATYEVTTESKHHQNETQTAEIYGQERVDLVFRLAAKKEQKKD